MATKISSPHFNSSSFFKVFFVLHLQWNLNRLIVNGVWMAPSFCSCASPSFPSHRRFHTWHTVSHSFIHLAIASTNVTETDYADFAWLFVQIFVLVYCLLSSTHHWEMMTSVGSHGTASLLFVMKVTVWYFVSDCHKVMIALAVILPSNCCCCCFCGDFSGISGIFHSSCQPQ